MPQPKTLVFIAAFLGLAYFYGGVNWNQHSRLNPIYSFVEPGTPDYLSFRMDRFIIDPERGVNTGDWALHDGHYYSNKPPGTVILGIPVYYALYHVERVLGLDPTEAFWIQVNAYLLNLWLSVFWTALAATVLFGYLRDKQATSEDAGVDPAQPPLLIAGLLVFATLMFPFSTSLWAHTTAASMLLISFCFRNRNGVSAHLICGSMLGLAVTVDYLAGAALPIFLATMLWEKLSLRHVAMVFATAGCVLLGLLVYQKVNFGGFFVTATQMSNPHFLDREKLIGNFGLFSPANAFGLTFSPSRGVFIYMPFLLFSLAQGILAFSRDRRAETAACLAMVGIIFFAVSSFVGWHGGSTSGSRYMITALPFFVLLTQVPAARWARWIFFGACAVSTLNMLVVSTVNTMLPDGVANPWWQNFYSRFLTGDFPQKNFLPHLV